MSTTKRNKDNLALDVFIRGLRKGGVFFYKLFTLLILKRLTPAMTRVIIIITRMAASNLEDEQEISERLLSLSQLCGLAFLLFIIPCQ